MSSKSNKTFPVSSALSDIKEKAGGLSGIDSDFFDFIDQLPDGPGKKLIIPFPYGPGKPRPYGWDLYPELHPSTDDEGVPYP